MKRQEVDWFGGDVDASIPSATKEASVPSVPRDGCDCMDHSSAEAEEVVAVGAKWIGGDRGDSCDDDGTHSVVAKD